PWELSPERQPDGRASAEKAIEMIETAMRDGSHFFEWTHRRLNGEVFPATVLLSCITLAGKAFLQATVRDITEQKQAEEALKPSQEQIQTILNSITDLFFALDREWRFTEVNPRAARLFGRPREQLVGRVIWELFPQTRDSEFYQRCHQAVAELVPAHFEG